MTELNAMRAELCRTSPVDDSDLRALFVNCTLKRSPEVSNTQGLADISMEIVRRQGVTVEVVRAIDHDIATGVWPDMTEHPSSVTAEARPNRCRTVVPTLRQSAPDRAERAPRP